MGNLRSKYAPIALGVILLASVVVLGYDNYKAHERVAILEASNGINEDIAAHYMLEFARCAKYVDIMHETCKCEE